MEEKFNILKGEIIVEKVEERDKLYPFCTIILFYVVSFLLIFILSQLFPQCKEKLIVSTLFWVVLVNLFIMTVTQVLHKWMENLDKNKINPHLFKNPQSVVTRCFAGILELFFYTLTITFGWFTLLAGFLFMKGLSVWKNEGNPSLEGASTAILRIAVVLSLLASIILGITLKNSLKENYPEIYISISEIDKN